MNTRYTRIHKINRGEASVWAEVGTAVFLKSIDAHGGPVELGGDQARELAAVLLEFAKEADEGDLEEKKPTGHS